MAVVKHSTTCTSPNNPDKEISSDAWNAEHVIEGLGTAAGSAVEDFEASGALAAHEAASDPKEVIRWMRRTRAQ